MLSDPLDGFEHLSQEVQARIDTLCDAFEARLKARGNAKIEEFLEQIDEPSRVHLQRELKAVEWQCRQDVTPLIAMDGELELNSTCVHQLNTFVQTATSPLGAGSEVGRFRIVRQLGKGGMGVVYEAVDTSLGRSVALKVLPPHVAQDSTLAARLAQEARILASLNHPNIATLYSFEEVDGQHLCVMEHVAGITLAERLRRGRLKPDEALPLFRQLSDALECAHAQGVVHRDLKPTNLMITSDGQLKVLDFGLAVSSWIRDEQANGEHQREYADAPRFLAGTIPYMSPEQVLGRPVDKRTDVWAYGCCLYEALTGERAFPGSKASDIATSILERAPDLTRIPDDVPRDMRFALYRCLRKDLEKRVRDIADAWIDDDQIDEFLRKTETSPRLWRRAGLYLSWLLAAACMTMVAALLLGRPRNEDASSRSYEISVPYDEPIILGSSSPLGIPEGSIDISSDGHTIAFAGRDRNGTKLFVTSDFNTTALNGTDGAYAPFFSPDGRSIGFFADGRLKCVSLDGGQPVDLCEVMFPLGATWSEDGQIYFADSFGERLMRVSKSGGSVSQVAGIDDKMVLRCLAYLPNSNGLLAFCDRRGIVHISPNSGKTTLIWPLKDAAQARYVEGGYLAFSQPGRLMAAPLDLDRLEFTSDPELVLDDLKTELDGDGQYAVAREDGTLVYIPGKPRRSSVLVRITADQLRSNDSNAVHANLLSESFPVEAHGTFALSPNGRRLAIEICREDDQVWIYDLATERRTRLTSKGTNRYPVWSPDGRWVAFSSNRSGAFNIYRKRADDDSQPAERIAPSEHDQFAYSWSSSGLAYREKTPAGQVARIVTIDEDGPNDLRPAKAGIYFAQTRFSPRGDLLTYTAFGRRNGFQVFLQRYSESRDRWPISSGPGGEEGVWSKSGDDVYYRRGQSWMAVSVDWNDGDSRPTIGDSRLLFSGYPGEFLNVPGVSYGVTPEGDFILLKSLQDPTPTKLRVILKWTADLKSLFPNSEH